MELAVHGKFSGLKFDVLVDENFHVGDFDDPDPGFAVPFVDQVKVIFQRSWIKVLESLTH